MKKKLNRAEKREEHQMRLRAMRQTARLNECSDVFLQSVQGHPDEYRKLRDWVTTHKRYSPYSAR